MNGRLDANIRDSIRARQIHSVVPAMVSLVNNRFAGLLSRNMAPHAFSEYWILELANATFAMFPNRPDVARGTTGVLKTSAAICLHIKLLLPPPVARISDGLTPISLNLLSP